MTGRSAAVAQPNDPNLTNREYDTFRSVCMGADSTKEIAREMAISTHTVAVYVGALYIKFHVNSYIGLLRLAARKYAEHPVGCECLYCRLMAPRIPQGCHCNHCTAMRAAAPNS